MDRQEAREILELKLSSYRSLGYDKLQRLLREQDTFETTGTSGTTYQLEIEAMWDGSSGGDLRVMGTIDDRGLRAVFPLASDFIIRPNGTFAHE